MYITFYSSDKPFKFILARTKVEGHINANTDSFYGMKMEGELCLHKSFNRTILV